jgi:hypothetical protein
VRFLFVDTATGKVCDAMGPFYEKAKDAATKVDSKNSYDSLFDPKKLAQDAEIAQSPLSYVPACGKE